MDYFCLQLSKNVVNPLVPEVLFTDKNARKYEDFSDVVVGQYVNDRLLEKTDIIMKPIIMISQEMLMDIKKYQDDLISKPAQFFSQDAQKIPVLYFLVNPAKANCLHKDAVIDPNGVVSRIILDKEKIPDKHIFMLDGVVESKIIISLDVAECLLNKNYYGIGLEKIDVK